MRPLPARPPGDVDALDDSARRLQQLQREVAHLMKHAGQRLDSKQPKIGDKLEEKVGDKVALAQTAVYAALQQIDGVLAAIAVERMRVASALEAWEATCNRIRREEQQR